MSLISNLINALFYLFTRSTARMHTDIDHLKPSENRTIINHTSINFQEYCNSLNHLVTIEQFVQELLQLAEEYKKITQYDMLDTPKNSNNIEFGILQQVYWFVVLLVNGVTLLISSEENEVKSSRKSTLVNVLMLNIISLTTKLALQIKKQVMVYAENPQLVHVS